MRRDPNARLVYTTAGHVPKPAQPAAPRQPASAKGGIRLRLERRASDRLVTVVTGLPGSAAEMAALARALKTACGAGGTVKDGALELQGDQRARVEAELAARALRWKRAGG